MYEVRFIRLTIAQVNGIRWVWPQWQEFGTEGKKARRSRRSLRILACIVWKYRQLPCINGAKSAEIFLHTWQVEMGIVLPASCVVGSWARERIGMRFRRVVKPTTRICSVMRASNSVCTGSGALSLSQLHAIVVEWPVASRVVVSGWYLPVLSAHGNTHGRSV